MCVNTPYVRHQIIFLTLLTRTIFMLKNPFFQHTAEFNVIFYVFLENKIKKIQTREKHYSSYGIFIRFFAWSLNCLKVLKTCGKKGEGKKREMIKKSNIWLLNWNTLKGNVYIGKNTVKITVISQKTCTSKFLIKKMLNESVKELWLTKLLFFWPIVAKKRVKWSHQTPHLDW